MEFWDSIVKMFSKIVMWTPSLVEASGITLVLATCSVTLGMVVGLILALGRISSIKIISRVCRDYIYFFRGSPLLMQLYFVYYGLPQVIPAFNVSDKFTAALIAFTLNTAAYLAEIFRAAIESIDKGQFEAAKSLGLNYWQTMYRVIIPQSYRRLIPPVGNEFIMVLKDTALVSSIGVVDLAKQTTKIQTTAGDPLVYLPAVAIYLILTAIFTFFFDKLEKKYSAY